MIYNFETLIIYILSSILPDGEVPINPLKKEFIISCNKFVTLFSTYNPIIFLYEFTDNTIYSISCITIFKKVIMTNELFQEGGFKPQI